jgi:hypothetical protein
MQQLGAPETCFQSHHPPCRMILCHDEGLAAGTKYFKPRRLA